VIKNKKNVKTKGSTDAEFDMR